MGYEQLLNYGVLGVMVAVLLNFVIKRLSTSLTNLSDDHQKITIALTEIVTSLKNLNGKKE